ncbi:MAG: pitrilysin family protein [Desulfuromonadaceae bacterium]|nr:pitrilysin family protein [Desulfuromonadaceae bacterium]
MRDNSGKIATLIIGLLLMVCGSALARVQSDALPERPDALTYEELHWELRTPDKIELENGIQIYHAFDQELPLVDITLMFGIGRSVESAANTGLMSLLATALESGGTRVISAQDFDAALNALATDLRVVSGPYTTTLSLSLLKEDLPIGLELLAQLVREPGFDPERLETSRQRLMEQVRRRVDNPGAIAELLMLENLYPNHPLGRKPSLETLEHIKRSDLVELHQRYFGPENLRVAISGCVSGAEARDLIQSGFSTWEKPTELPQVPELSTPDGLQGNGPVIVASRPLAQTTLRLVERGISKDNPDVYALEVMNFILGGGGFNSRLMQEIRSNRGLAYSVFSYFSVGRCLQGAFIAGCETKTESVPEVVGLFASIMQTLRAGGVSEAELVLAQQSQINSFVFHFENLHSLVTQAMEHDFFGYPADYLARYREHISAVTTEDVYRVANKYLDPQRQTIIVVGDINPEQINQIAQEREVIRVDPAALL